MKYTDQEKKKLAELNRQTLALRKALADLKKKKSTFTKTATIAYVFFTRKRRQIERTLQKKGRKLSRAIDRAARPYNRKLILLYNRLDNLQVLSSDVSNVAYQRAQEEQRQRRIAKATSALLTPTELKLVKLRLRDHSSPIENGKVIVYKVVSSTYKTREGFVGETLYKIGSTVTVSDWNPRGAECGNGKFHACYRPAQCDQFRNDYHDKYIAIEVDVKDLFAWPSSCPTFVDKIAFRTGKVLYRCDRNGKEMRKE